MEKLIYFHSFLEGSYRGPVETTARLTASRTATFKKWFPKHSLKKKKLGLCVGGGTAATGLIRPSLKHVSVCSMDRNDVSSRLFCCIADVELHSVEHQHHICQISIMSSLLPAHIHASWTVKLLHDIGKQRSGVSPWQQMVIFGLL